AKGAPEECGCEPCRNFVAQRSTAYPAQAHEIFTQLGIAANREAEVYHIARLKPGRHLYGGWFHFVGAIQEGRDASRQIAPNSWQPDLEKMSERFSVGCTCKTGLVPASFGELPLVQVEFTVELQWVLEASEPQ